MNGQPLGKKGDRVWEIDALRGFLILLVLCNHLNVAVEAFCINGVYSNFDSYAWANATDPLHFWFDWDADGVIYKEDSKNLHVPGGRFIFYYFGIVLHF